MSDLSCSQCGFSRVCLLLLCGAPASGKSSLAGSLESLSRSLAAAGLPSHAAEGVFSGTVSVSRVEVDCLEDSEGFEPCSWKAARRRAVCEAERLLQRLCPALPLEGETRCCCWESPASSSSRRCACSLSLLVVDDTFHAPSLRKPFYQLARKCTTRRSRR